MRQRKHCKASSRNSADKAAESGIVSKRPILQTKRKNEDKATEQAKRSRQAPASFLFFYRIFLIFLLEKTKKEKSLGNFKG
ncbi:hypothetical protein FYJ62_01045 [Lactobacillus porci]|uniref:Uncharacterized protein n=1 Tax=Lactobacillus porci TaxID=2012477 RepID=A0A6A8M9A2_9LACO|nr:hypothetical protein [Lactobacillus porci]